MLKSIVIYLVSTVLTLALCGLGIVGMIVLLQPKIELHWQLVALVLLAVTIIMPSTKFWMEIFMNRFEKNK